MQRYSLLELTICAVAVDHRAMMAAVEDDDVQYRRSGEWGEVKSTAAASTPAAAVAAVAAAAAAATPPLLVLPLAVAAGHRAVDDVQEHTRSRRTVEKHQEWGSQLPPAPPAAPPATVATANAGKVPVLLGAPMLPSTDVGSSRRGSSQQHQ